MCSTPASVNAGNLFIMSYASQNYNMIGGPFTVFSRQAYNGPTVSAATGETGILIITGSNNTDTGTATFTVGSGIVGATWTQSALSSTSSASGTAGGNTTHVAQAGQAATGASNNGGAGGNLILSGGVGGTSGSATAGKGGVVSITSGIQEQQITVTTTYTVDTNSTTSDFTIFLNPSGAFTVTLPAPTAGRVLRFKDISGTAGTNHVTISQHSSETIDGATTYVLNINWAGIVLQSNGTNWYVFSEYNGTVI
jgi:hypothetical protein